MLARLWRWVSGDSAIWLLALAIMGSLALAWRVDHIQGQLALERQEHKATAQERDAALREGLRWKALADNGTIKITALQQEAAACLQRENEIRADAAARSAIMSKAVPAKRPVEKGVIVDDATRKAAAGRLNRPL